MIDSISIVIPAIRQNRWLDLYNSIPLTCKKYKWELVFGSPFDLPAELQDKDNITLVKDFGNVNRVVHKTLLETKFNHFFLTVDDCQFAEDALDAAIDLYNEKCTEKDIVSAIYGEGGDKQDISYWTVARHGDFRKRLIDQSWKLAMQPIVAKKRFIEMGGFDQQFEYMDKSVHDWAFRNQLDGSKIYHSPYHICIATWYPGTTKDHSAVHYAQTEHDEPIFNAMWNKDYRQIKLNFDDWKNSPEIWQRRFTKGVSNSYSELIQKEGYVM